MNHRSARRALERHFVQGLPPAEETAFRRHLEDCESCRARYERYALLSAFDRKLLPAEERLARGLGLSRARPRGMRVWGPLGLAAACAAVLLFFLPSRGSSDAGPTFDPRGQGQPATFSLLIFRMGAKSPTLLAGEMKRADELAFAYVNPTAKPFLAIFATDEQHRVYWYHPGWRAGEAAPRSIPTVHGTELQELKESGGHPLGGRHVVISAVLSDHPLGVEAIEGALARGAPLTTLDPTAVIAARREVEIQP